MHFSVKEDIIQLTEKWDGQAFSRWTSESIRRGSGRDKRSHSGRGMAADVYERRPNQFEEKLKRLHEDKTKLVGRAVTCSFMPARPDLEETVKEDRRF